MGDIKSRAGVGRRSSTRATRRDGEGRAKSQSSEVVHRVDHIRAVVDQHHLCAGGDRHTRLAGYLDRDRRSRRVVNEVELLLGRDHQRPAARAGQFQIHIPGNTGSTVRDRDGVGSARAGILRVAADRLFNQRAEVRVGSSPPRTGLFAGTDEFDTKISRVRGGHLPYSGFASTGFSSS